MYFFENGFSVSYAGATGDVRPVISLKPKTELTDGTGTATDPFIILS